MFKQYLSKIIIRHAHEIQQEDSILSLEGEESTSLLLGEVRFKHYEPVKTGDFIVRLTEDDTYHCSRAVFLDRNEVECQQTFDFGLAIKFLKAGAKIARTGWNGNGMFAYYVPANRYSDVTKQSGLVSDKDGKAPYREYLALKTAQNDIAVWNPSTSDCLANDWVIIP